MNALIAGSVHNVIWIKPRIFRQMQSASMRPNSVTILSIIPACANVISAWKVREIHASILHYDLQNNTSVANTLIDAYAKSGNMASAKAVFDGLKLRDLISWNSIIGACVMHGHSHSARNLFLEMEMEGMNRIMLTFASNVNQAQDLLSTMENEYQLMKRLEHYTAMVGLYGRSGGLREASDLVENMSIVPDFAFWDAFFTAARIYENIRLANLAAENLFKLEPRNPRIHRLLSHVQALCGQSYNLSKVRKPKKARKFDDSYGCSWLEVRNKVYCFFNGVSFDLEKYNQFKTMIDDFKPVLTDRGNSRLDFEEEKEEVGGIHSEKKAIAFGIINSPKFTNIRIMKSVRMCTHCHTFAKLISKQYDRD
ncbi:Pentatricopeptide repeat-containing protein, partial [Ananas comosus]